MPSVKRRNGTGKSWKGKSEIGVDSEGTLTIKKLGSWVSRSTNEVIMIYGAEQ